ncbi:hypothetical protein M9H77_34648 [Catharanthus roseus]|uniref:Uncharacterized protein n=1 Tax=Catharanthus roseus TaxID=4058 RepID=A0ACB9ZMH5_CATRO|nr:hypothetical protein M9H77_34648 [Catharanthus roseus]
MLGAAPQDSSCSTHEYSHAEYDVSSFDLTYRCLVRSLHIEGEVDKRGDDDGDDEQPVPVAPVALASGSDGHPRHGKGKGKGLTGSRSKRPDVVREVLALTQKRKKGGLVEPEFIPSYDGHVEGPIWHGQDRGSLKC